MCNKILLVDDDESLISALSLYLSSQGFYIEVADSMNTALALLRNQVPDLIISDIMMPQKDGYTFLKFLKNTSKYQAIPFIFLSAKGMTIDRIIGYNLGCYGYLVKPFDPEELLAMIYNILSNFHIKNSNQSIVKKTSPDALPLKQSIDSYFDLTFREDTILRCVLKGMTNKEIAIQLSLSLRNVEKYVSRLLAKTETRNRTELTQYFYKHQPYYLEGE